MNNVTRLQLASDTVSAPATITPAELKSLLGWLGLPKTWFAHRLGLKDERQVARWEDGVTPIPERAAAELLKLWNEAAEQLAEIVKIAAENATPDGVIRLCTYRVDKDGPPSGYPSSYHRALMCRAMDHLLMRTSCRVQLHYYEGNP